MPTRPLHPVPLTTTQTITAHAHAVIVETFERGELVGYRELTGESTLANMLDALVDPSPETVRKLMAAFGEHLKKLSQSRTIVVGVSDVSVAMPGASA